MTKFKKIIAVLLAAVAVIIMQTAVFAETKSGKVGNCNYTFNTSTGALSLTGSGEMGIEMYYFRDKSGFAKDIKTVYVSGGITDIGPYVFYECTGITKVFLSNSVTKIGRYAFQQDSSITYVNFPEGLTTIDTGAFYNCTSLENIDLCSTVTTINSSAFCNTGLTTVSIPPNVTYIGSHAFGYNGSGSSYTAKSGFLLCVVPGSKGFEYATNNSITRYTSAWSMDDRTGTVTIYGSGGMNLPRYIFEDRIDVKTIVVSEGITTVGSYVFGECYGLKTVQLPSTVTTINSCAFQNCTSLTAVNFPNKLTTINTDAFSGCTALTNISLPKSLRTVGQRAFLTTGIKSIVIPSTTTSIGTYAFGFNYTNGSYTKVSGFKIYTNKPSSAASYATNNGFTLVDGIGGTTGACKWSFDTATGTLTISGTGAPGSYTSFASTPWYADFGLKGAIEKVVYGSGVTKTGNYVFTDCTSLKELVLSDTVTEVGQYAFRNTGIESFVAPKNLTLINHSAFRDCKKLKYVELKNGFKDLSFKAFADDTALDYIVIPERIIVFETNALDGMKSGFRVFAYADVSGLGSYAKTNGYKFIKMGNVDVDSNNVVDKNDAQLLLRYLSGEVNLTENARIAAKITDHTKSKADMRDVIQILKNAR